jgi:hypothetical protein
MLLAAALLVLPLLSAGMDATATAEVVEWEDYKVTEWLTRQGLGKYSAAFDRHEYDDLAVLRSMTAADLATLGANVQLTHGASLKLRQALLLPDSGGSAAVAAPPTSNANGELNARDFGAAGDGVADDTQALQKAISAAQTEGRQLLIPSGTYMITAPLRVKCLNAICADTATPGAPQTTNNPLRLRGEGMYLTHIVAGAAIDSMLDMSGNNLTKPTDAHGGYDTGNWNVSVYHEIVDLHLQGICSPTSIPISIPEYHCPAPNNYPSGKATYGIYGAGLTRSLFRRLQINNMDRDGAIFWYCWYNRIEDSAIWGNGIGLHSACNNMRITGSDLHANTITGILIDGGAAIDIVGNLIEGNAGRVHPTHPPTHSRLTHLLTYCWPYVLHVLCI